MTIEQKVAHTLSQGNLRHDPRGTTGADVVGALAFTEKMGSLLWRVLVGNDKAAVEPLARAVVDEIIRPRDKFGFVLKLARIAVREYVDVRCISCGGRGTVANEAHVIRTCGKCEGSGNQRTQHARRVRELKCSEDAYTRIWESRFSEAFNVLRAADVGAAHNIRQNLKHYAACD